MTNQPQQDVCCLMGDPVAGNPTQYMLEKAFAAARLDWRFLTFEVPPREFEGALRGARIFGFHGIMLAPPHRAPVLPYLEEKSDAARLSEQVNCVKQFQGRLHGYNTEGQALRQLVEQATPLAGAKVTIVGGGRLARSIGAEVALAGAEELLFVCRRPESIESFVQTLNEETPVEKCCVEPLDANVLLSIQDTCQLLVNATPVGRHQPYEELPLDLKTLPKETVVADVVYNPPGTWLVREAARQGNRTLDGLTLLIEQAAIAFEIWTGISADRTAMREAVEEFLVL